jgi:hypothetical protein
VQTSRVQISLDIFFSQFFKYYIDEYSDSASDYNDADANENYETQDETRQRNEYSYNGYQTNQMKFNNAVKMRELNRTSVPTSQHVADVEKNGSYSKNFKYAEDVETELEKLSLPKRPLSLKRKSTLDKLSVRSAGSKSQREAKPLADNIEVKSMLNTQNGISDAHKSDPEPPSFLNTDSLLFISNKQSPLFSKPNVVPASELEVAANDIATQFTTATLKLLMQLEIKFPGKTNEQTRLFLTQVGISLVFVCLRTLQTEKLFSPRSIASLKTTIRS